MTWLREPRDYDPKRRSGRVKGEMELVFPAPPGRKIQWLSLGGFFSTHQGEAAVETKNAMWYALGDSGEWTLAYRANVPRWHSHWHYAHDKEIMLKTPVEKVRVRYVGQPGVNGVRVNIHAFEPGEEPDQGIVVTHGFKMGGELYEKRFVLEGPTEYTVECPQTPENVFIRMEAPGDDRGVNSW